MTRIEKAAASAARERRLLVVLAAFHGAVLLVWPGLPVIALGLWWNANTVSHGFVHRPASGWRGRVLSCYLSLLLGFPHPLWRRRHLAHHRGAVTGLAPERGEWPEYLLVGLLWGGLALLAPAFLLGVYLPGFGLGQLLCAVHGYYEHRGGTTSHYGRLYNLLFLRDGYHVEHHRHPQAPFRALPALRGPGGRVSSWPPVLRWLEGHPLDRLERLATRSAWVRRWLLRCHRRALEPLLQGLGPVRRVAVVGGGLFPRTALLVRELWPAARIDVIEAEAAHLEAAARWLKGQGVNGVVGSYDPERHRGYELVVLPLAYRGDREALAGLPPAPWLLVHDWLWRRPGRGRIVSLLLLKKVYLVCGRVPALPAAESGSLERRAAGG